MLDIRFKIIYLADPILRDMENELREKRNKRYANMRAIIDFGMGALYLAVAFLMFFADKIGFDWIGFDKVFRYIFGAICLLYGGWRIYRGIKKEYF